jgi:hypothetical protein
MATEFETEVLRSLGELHANMNNLRQELLGNGQPGRIQRIEEVIEKHSEEIKDMERKIWSFSGGLVVCSHFLKALISKLFGGHWS